MASPLQGGFLPQILVQARQVQFHSHPQICGKTYTLRLAGQVDPAFLDLTHTNVVVTSPHVIPAQKHTPSTHVAFGVMPGVQCDGSLQDDRLLRAQWAPVATRARPTGDLLGRQVTCRDADR